MVLGLSFSKHPLGTKQVPGAGNGEGEELAWSRRENMGFQATWRWVY